jgi:hypothetical protein
LAARKKMDIRLSLASRFIWNFWYYSHFDRVETTTDPYPNGNCIKRWFKPYMVP